MFWVPASGDLGVGVSILSTAAECSSGSSPTASSAPTRSESSTRFAPEFEKLLTVTLMLPWTNEVSRLAAPAH